MACLPRKIEIKKCRNEYKGPFHMSFNLGPPLPTVTKQQKDEIKKYYAKLQVALSFVLEIHYPH